MTSPTRGLKSLSQAAAAGQHFHPRADCPCSGKLRRTSFVFCSAGPRWKCRSGGPDQPHNLSFPTSDLTHSLPFPSTSPGQLSLPASRQHLPGCSSSQGLLRSPWLLGLLRAAQLDCSYQSLSLGSGLTLGEAGTGLGDREGGNS